MLLVRIDQLVEVIRRAHMTVAQVIWAVSVSCSLLCFSIALGNIISIYEGDEQLNFVLLYPIMFIMSGIGWASVTMSPTARRCSFAAALAAVPAIFRSADFGARWITAGSDKPGTQIVAIAGWAMIGVLCIALAMTIPLIANRVAD